MKVRAKYVSIERAYPLGVAERWHQQYYRDGKWVEHAPNAEAVYNQLVALGQTTNPAVVADITGNKSWSYISCDGCLDYVERAVQIGAEGSERHRFCATCIAEAAYELNPESLSIESMDAGDRAFLKNAMVEFKERCGELWDAEVLADADRLIAQLAVS